MLQATQMTQEVTIRDLESEKSRLKEKLSQLEEERNLLQSKTQSLDERQRQQILALEKVKQLIGFSWIKQENTRILRQENIMLEFLFDMTGLGPVCFKYISCSNKEWLM